MCNVALATLNKVTLVYLRVNVELHLKAQVQALRL
jgi:hypothetical protein